MSARAQASVVDTHALDEAALEALVDELYEVQREIFDGVSRDAFARYVVRSSAERTRIEVYRAQGRVVGYAAWHMFERRVQQRVCAIVRCEVGLLRAYRGQTRFGWFFTKEALGQLMRAPTTDIYGLSCATSPGTYRTISAHVPEIWPHWSRPTPPHLAELLETLADEFGLQPVDPERPGAYHVGWRTRETDDEAARWRASDDPATRYYLEHTPGYREGHGFLFLVPMNARRFAQSVANLVTRRLRRSMRRRPPPATPSRHAAPGEGRA